MFYRILAAPPGYKPPQSFMIARYESDLMPSKGEFLKDKNGEVFTETLDEARSRLPKNAVKVPTEVNSQFIELWRDTSD